MKLGVSGTPAHPQSYPPLTFRALSMVLGLPVLAAALVWMKVPLALSRAAWGQVLRLAVTNMMIWHIVVIVSLQQLSSGRSAILGYTMPVFSALWGWFVFKERLSWRQMLGVAAAALGVVLLLWSEFSHMQGAPWAALALLGAACIWAFGTHELRRVKLAVPLLTAVFWMTAVTAVQMAALGLLFEHAQWRMPEPPVWGAIAYNAVGVFGFAHAAWFYLARGLPVVASSISVMLIPVVGTFSGALALGEALHWQDYAAMGLMVLAIAAVLLGRPASAR
jgi:drug/metabolite transporter (DMT)-like permease